jgi:hypothetical protein
MKKRVNNFGFTLVYLPDSVPGYIALDYVLGEARIVIMENGEFYVTGRDAYAIRFNRLLVSVIAKLYDVLKYRGFMSNTEMYILVKREYDNVMDLIYRKPRIFSNFSDLADIWINLQWIFSEAAEHYDGVDVYSVGRLIDKFDKDALEIEVYGGIDTSDAPEFSEVYAEEATYRGEKLTEAELEHLNEELGDVVAEKFHSQI